MQFLPCEKFAYATLTNCKQQNQNVPLQREKNQKHINKHINFRIFNISNDIIILIRAKNIYNYTYFLYSHCTFTPFWGCYHIQVINYAFIKSFLVKSNAVFHPMHLQPSSLGNRVFYDLFLSCELRCFKTDFGGVIKVEVGIFL